MWRRRKSQLNGRGLNGFVVGGRAGGVDDTRIYGTVVYCVVDYWTVDGLRADWNKKCR